MATPTSSQILPPKPSSSDFDIVATYRRLLASDPDLTMPIAAIEALVEALSHSSATTISETLTLLEHHTANLKRSISNPISLSAGTDLFRRYLYTTVQKPGATGDFQAIRNHLLSNGRQFVERTKAARDQIASFGRHFVRDGTTVLTNGGSRVVGALLRSAADASGGRTSIRFRVIYVLSPSTSSSSSSDKASTLEGEGAAIVSMLRSRGVPVATIPESAVAYSLPQVSMVIVGAEGVVESGGIISRLGTYQMGMLARAAGKPLYVVAESHKFVRLYPLGQYDLGIEQKVIEFKVIENGKEEVVETERGTPLVGGSARMLDEGVGMEDEVGKEEMEGVDEAVDFTPPELISGIITESGVLTPSAVSEELIKIWF
ncbi:nagb/rpia/CoA transferase-like protein [Pseudovirgaria hyperparasitica]|uniref:Translation initiation factor eIF2B subunit alpha n=1 Tax=Pseudovirgaria hyperparasitica TaxID=470096 RepID=A0A6A6VZK0_9PEZI|nr:nagb/rpia/CoA transferase-like protein [Pseudovirgaria hyperparasitica]KAF2755309.1 nagb/rpia/CoA transferase-like protein [Pseudovirgaria hyperparasitica]